MFIIQTPFKRGFTLVELIVVLTIIGILSAVVYANFGDARKQSRDKAIEAQMEILRLEARLYFERFNEYSPNGQRDDSLSDCSGTNDPHRMGTSMFGNHDAPPGIVGEVKSPEISRLVQKIGTLTPPDTRVYCAASTSTWAFAAPLNATPQITPYTLWCVDSTGVAKKIKVDEVIGDEGQWSHSKGLNFANFSYICPPDP